MSSPSPQRSIARRVTLWVIGMVGLALAVVAVTISILTEREIRPQVLHTVGGTVDSLVLALDSLEEANRVAVLRTFRVFRSSFQSPPTRAEESNGAGAHNDFGTVERFSQETGGIATVFLRKGDDFVVIETSLKEEKSESAQNSLLGRSSPAYQRMLNGQEHTGRVELFGKHYMGHYGALKDDAGKVVGGLFVGIDISSSHLALSKQVLETRFFDSGGAYVILPGKTVNDAVFVVHPSAAGKKVLEAYPQAGPFLTALGSASDGLVTEASALRGVAVASPWALQRSSKSNGWWVVAEVSDAEAMAGHNQVIWMVWLVMGLAVVALGLGLFVVLRSSVSRPLHELTQAIILVAQGDLTQAFRSTRRDEVGTLVREVEGMRERYLQMLLQVRQAADSITVASAEIASGNQDLSTRTEDTASSLQEIAQNMEELTAIVSQSADATSHANDLACSAAQVAQRGGNVVGQVVSSIESIHHSSRKIADIAFQTNILTLNVAVEATRAGAQGQGFAAIASEVRSLADHSASAAHEIKALIDVSGEKVDAGTLLVENAGTTMQEIFESIQSVGELIGEIAAVASEQSDGISQINAAISQLDQMTQQNAALVEQSAAAAMNLRDQARRLDAAVQVFRLHDLAVGTGLALVPAQGFHTATK
ncbi:MAG: Cache 3/Cache 2 fusion domain-containing protein [Burkholderiaceae bacterium]|nr:Cache 3/Cache 2 fusion domain-containing protein [Burkholderiaceae bacterium]